MAPRTPAEADRYLDEVRLGWDGPRRRSTPMTYQEATRRLENLRRFPWGGTPESRSDPPRPDYTSPAPTTQPRPAPRQQSASRPAGFTPTCQVCGWSYSPAVGHRCTGPRKDH
jgi:hypothetical protein